MLASISSSVLRGVDGVPVTVEVHVAGGLPAFTVVGLPDAACREARDRVRAAILSSGLRWPQQRITVNLAPSGLPKAGSGLDLPMAIGVLVASGLLERERVDDVAFLGELGLDGAVRAVAGTVPLVEALAPSTVVVAPTCQAEAAILGRHRVRAASTLAAVVAALEGAAEWMPSPSPERGVETPSSWVVGDLAEVRGQPLARRAIEVAAAGGHHLLLVGPPGAGKTMLAQRLVGLLPPLDPSVALETTKVHSAAGERLPAGGLISRAPFRAPHHGASMAALVGGGSSWLRPGGDQPGQWWRAVPRRTRRVRAGSARCPPSAARGGSHPSCPGTWRGVVPSSLPPRRRLEPLPVRQRRHAPAVSLLRGGPAPVPTSALRAAARPVRPAARGATARRRPSYRPGCRGGIRGGCRQGHGGARGRPPTRGGSQP